MPETTAYIALGANLSDRAGNLHEAVRRLHAVPGVRVTSVSSFLDNPSVGGPAGAPPFLNAAAEVQTSLEPAELLERLLEIERRMGRVRGERNDPRPIDLDLLLYGDRVMTTDRLTLPHPRMHERRFVLQPLAEIAPVVVHPGQQKTIAQLLAECPGNRVRPATNRDAAQVQDLVFGVLREYDLKPDPADTDADLADIESAYHARGGSFDVLEAADGSIVGTVGIYPREPGVCELRKMYLHPSFRGRGLGKRLLEHALGKARDIGFRRMVLETASVLKEAVALYKRYGFQPYRAEHQASRCDQTYFLDLDATKEWADLIIDEETPCEFTTPHPKLDANLDPPATPR